jgi:hypothetical protein
MEGWQKLAIGLVVLVVLYMIGEAIEDELSSSGPRTAVEKASASGESDKEAYLTFYKEILRKGMRIDDIYVPFKNAIARNDFIGAVSVASDIKDEMDQAWSELYGMKVPKLKNEDVRKMLEEGKNLLSSSYLNKIEAVEAVIKYAKDPSPYNLSQIKNKAEKVQQPLMLGMLSLTSAGTQIGLSSDELTRVGASVK